MKSQEMPTAATMLRKPPWLKVRLPHAEKTLAVTRHLSSCRLHTVCQEARCPNLGECFQAGTATFLILGDCCTRNCRYCNVRHGIPEAPDEEEAERLASAVARLGLTYVVMTSVTRDDLPDGGAGRFVRCIERIRESCPGCRVEVLIPDFKASRDALKIVMDARPEILNHNVETVPSLFKRVQPQDHYEWSEAVLRNAKELDPEVLTKSGIMLGLGETMHEIKAVMRDLRSWGVDILTIGQYLQPSRRHLPIERYYTLEEFAELKQYGEKLGFGWVESAPLVRSSYHAVEQVRALSHLRPAVP